MKVIMMEVGKPAEVKEIDGSLKGMQKIVGGLIELFCPFKDNTVGIIVNEEGKILDLMENRMVFIDDQPDDILCGPAFVVGLDSEDGEFVSLTDEQITELMPRITDRYILC